MERRDLQGTLCISKQVVEICRLSSFATHIPENAIIILRHLPSDTESYAKVPVKEWGFVRRVTLSSVAAATAMA
jgi:hypothetical protein